VLRQLGRRPAGGNHRTVQRYAARRGVSTAHFDPRIGRRERVANGERLAGAEANAVRKWVRLYERALDRAA
jgi:hypothetical protein